MLIGELANKSGYTRDTIRFYEKAGLVKGIKARGGTNGYRHYDEAALERLLLVRQAKLLGFTLAEIRRLIGAWESNALSPAQKAGIFSDKIALIDERLAELKRVRQYLVRKRKNLAGT